MTRFFRVDSDVLAIFKARAEVNGWCYQTMMNDALRQAVQGITIADVVRETIRETLGANLTKEGKRISSK